MSKVFRFGIIGCGAIGVIQGTTLANPGEPRTITISGEKGTVVLQEDTIVRWEVEGQPVQTGVAFSAFIYEFSSEGPELP